MKVTIVGLGYVGLPLACLCASKDHAVSGLDIDQEKVEKINAGERSLKGKATTDPTVLDSSDVVIVCVPTPIDDDNKPNLEPLKSAVETISEHLKDDQLVIIESTIYPGTTEEVLKPILEKAGKEFYLAHCPERIDPGNKDWTVENLPRVVGAVTSEGKRKAAEFYRTILTADVLELSSVKAAEAVKVMENTFRDVNIAFINEMAKSFDKVGIDITEVIRGASTKPFAFMPHYPGCGVGGHCIPVDPYYLIEKAKNLGFDHEFLKLARKINKSMPLYTVELLEKELGGLQGTNVGILGVSYKKDVDDTRESPSKVMIKALGEKGANVFVYDPHAKKESNVGSLDELLEKSSAVVLATNHTEFKEMDTNKLKESGIEVVIDGRNCLDKEKILGLGIKYKGIGR